MKILLGVGGGIAAYKAAELARLLMQEGHEVQVVMTAAARGVRPPLTFAALTGRKVLTDLFAIEVAPSSTSRRAGTRAAGDRARDRRPAGEARPRTRRRLPYNPYLAFTGPVVIAPAMNVNMWQHPATQANLETLRKRGHTIVEPGDGYLACGMTGPGRLAEPETIAKRSCACQARGGIWKARRC